MLFRSLQTYVFLLVIPADAVLFCRAAKDKKVTYMTQLVLVSLSADVGGICVFVAHP